MPCNHNHLYMNVNELPNIYTDFTDINPKLTKC